MLDGAQNIGNGHFLSKIGDRTIIEYEDPETDNQYIARMKREKLKAQGPKLGLSIKV